MSLPLAAAQRALTAGFLMSPRVVKVTVQAVDAQAGTVTATTANVRGWRSEVQTTHDGTRPVTRCRWRLLAADLAGRPLIKWRVVDGSDTWVIDGADVACLATRYVCPCTKAL